MGGLAGADGYPIWSWLAVRGLVGLGLARKQPTVWEGERMKINLVSVAIQGPGVIAKYVRIPDGKEAEVMVTLLARDIDPYNPEDMALVVNMIANRGPEAVADLMGS